MFHRLQALADSKGLEFGLKLSNTFPVDTTRGELPNDEMYMSGRSLFPLTIEMCNRISRAFEGKMRISFAGGADAFNCDKPVSYTHLRRVGFREDYVRKEMSRMQVKSFLLTIGAGIAVGALGAMMLPKNSEVYQFTNDAASTIKQEAEKAIQSMTN